MIARVVRGQRLAPGSEFQMLELSGTRMSSKGACRGRRGISHVCGVPGRRHCAAAIVMDPCLHDQTT